MGMPEAKNMETCGKQKSLRELHPSHFVYFIRCLIVLLAGLCVYHTSTLQYCVNWVWGYLLTSWLFNSVYFETWFTTFCYAVIIPLYPFSLHYMKFMNKYKLHPQITYKHVTVWKIVKDAILYLTPLMILDTVKVKHYYGVDLEILAERKKSWVQITQTLPMDPPTVGRLLFDVTASIVLYDVIFFFIHYLFHRNHFLYKHVHMYHHDHDVLHPHVTNQLTVTERLTLVLSANVSLKIFRSHPLTRMMFIPIFITMLVDNHTGYDLPFGLHQIVPFGLYGGSVSHLAHHEHGGQAYQPFFSYIDQTLEAVNKLYQNERKG